MRESAVAELGLQDSISAADIAKLDRGGRCIVGDTLWTKCSEEARAALLNDPHHFVRSVARIAQRGAMAPAA